MAKKMEAVQPVEQPSIYNAKEKETAIFKCEACGSNLIYFPKDNKLGCLHCGAKVDFPKDSNIIPMDFLSNTKKNMQSTWNETVVYRCNNCGAKEIISKYEIAKSCPFCGTTNVVVTNELPGLTPNAILPFKIDVEDAKRNFKAWIKKDFLAPNRLKKWAESDQINGVYSPCYSFSTNTFSTYSGKLGKYYTVSNGKTTQTRIRYFNINGRYDFSFKDILIECGPKITQNVVEKLKPFLIGDAYKYNQRFLSGYSASNYDKTAQVSFEEAKSIMQRILREKILSKYSYDVVADLNISTSYNDINFNYLLLPIYICNYKYNNKVFNFYINGTNGKVYGKKPRSAWKITGLLLGAAAIITGIVFLVKLFIG